jgi:hypothetical protein
MDTLAFFTLLRFCQREAKKRKTSVKRAKAPSAKEKKARSRAIFLTLPLYFGSPGSEPTHGTHVLAALAVFSGCPVRAVLFRLSCSD